MWEKFKTLIIISISLILSIIITTTIFINLNEDLKPEKKKIVKKTKKKKIANKKREKRKYYESKKRGSLEKFLKADDTSIIDINNIEQEYKEKKPLYKNNEEKNIINVDRLKKSIKNSIKD